MSPLSSLCNWAHVLSLLCQTVFCGSVAWCPSLYVWIILASVITDLLTVCLLLNLSACLDLPASANIPNKVLKPSDLSVLPERLTANLKLEEGSVIAAQQSFFTRQPWFYILKPLKLCISISFSSMQSNAHVLWDERWKIKSVLFVWMAVLQYLMTY